MVLIISSSTDYQTLCIFEFIQFMSTRLMHYCMCNLLLQKLTASQTMFRIEWCDSPISGLADYSPFQNELPHFDDETYPQLNLKFYHANTMMNYLLLWDSNTLSWYYISISDLCKKILMILIIYFARFLNIL